MLISLDSKYTGKVVKISQSEFYLSNITTNKEITKTFDKEYLKKIEINLIKME